MVTKQKWLWACQECGHNQVKWAGQCPACKEWNSLVEEKSMEIPSQKRRLVSPWASRSVKLGDVRIQDYPRWKTKLPELDRLLGGGVVPGLFALVGGEPGVGKSTLMMQLAAALTKQDKKVLYVCGEESVTQTSLRAERLKVKAKDLYLYNEGSLSDILSEVKSLQPQIVIIDSIQILYKEDIPSAPGSVTQVRECAADLMHLAKKENITIFVIGHVTKSGEIAGPRVLEHLVDTVLYFEGDKQNNYRLLRAVKNRFGTTDEVAVFYMGEEGLQEVQNPSALFLEERQREQAGSVIIPTLEGTRPILVEVQALVTKTAYPAPSRRSAGIDTNRLSLLLAVAEKHLNYKMYNSDVFVSVAGGMRIQEPSADLGVLLAIASSYREKPIDSDTVVIGEIGLGGEVRSVPKMELRLKEAQRMGFSKVICPKRSLNGLSKDAKSKIELCGVDNVREAASVAGL